MGSEVQWRRSWKRDLLSKSWSVLEKVSGVEGTVLVKSLFTDDSYQLLISDLTHVWYEEAEGIDIKRKNKKLNPNVEAPIDKLVDHLRDHLESTKSSAEFSFKVKETDDGTKAAQLAVTTKLAGLPFTWKFTCREDREMLCPHLTSPLLTMVAELNRRQSELFALLAAKDKELHDLKGQGAKVSRRQLVTGDFDPTSFINAMATSKGLESSVEKGETIAFGEAGKAIYEDVMVKSSWLRKKASGDVDSDTEAGDGAVGPSVGQSWANRIPASIAASPSKSPGKSPAKSPKVSSAEPSPIKDSELLRREALQKRLLDEQEKKETQKKKKKKLKL